VPPSLAGHGAAAGMGATSASGSRFLVLALCMFGCVVRVAERLP
jgi:hypothetical protein